MTAESLNLYFGVTNWNKDKLNAYEVAQIYYHPQYNKKSRRNSIGDGFDLAMLRTKTVVILSPKVQLICLPSPMEGTNLILHDQSVSVQGFGSNGRN